MADAATLRKCIAKFFDRNGFSLQFDGLRYLEGVLKNQTEPLAQEKLEKFLNNIYTICQQTGRENTYMVNKDLLEEALKLGVGLSTPMDIESVRGTQTAGRRGASQGQSMDVEPMYKDKITEKINSSFIVLSNFGELPYICFRNQARAMEVIPNKERSILVSGKELIERWIDKYHKMRFLIKNSGVYIYQHEIDQKGMKSGTGMTILHEIGTLCGAKGKYSIFGVVFKKGKKFYIQDTLSTIEVNFDKASFKNGFYHEKHFLILTGEMQTNFFLVTEASQPLLDNCEPAKLASGKNYDLGGFKTKYLSLIKDMESDITEVKDGIKISSRKDQLAKKYLGIFEFEKKPTGIVYVFSDFNIQDQANITLFEDMVISLSLESTTEDSKPDAIILCGPFMNDILINSKEDQSLLEETYQNFSNLLLKHQRTLKNIIIGMIPDISDPVMNLIPRKPLPEYLLQKVCQELPKFCLLENPVHFSYFGKNTVIFRSDLLKILARKEFIKIGQRNNLESYVNTLLGQRSLAPVSSYCMPRTTGYEDALEMFVLPDCLVLCDNLCESESIEKRGGCSIFTAGSVTRNKTFLEVNFSSLTARQVSRAN